MKLPAVLVVKALLIFSLISSGQAFAQENLPDLRIDTVHLDSNNSLVVAISNKGAAEVPPGKGKLAIFVNEKMVDNLALSSLGDQSFRAVEGSTSIQTAIRLAQKQRVLIVIDAAKEIDEQDEFQNTVSFTATPIPTTGYDLSVDIFRPSFTSIATPLRLVFKNVGNIASPSNLRVDCNLALKSGQGVQYLNFSTQLPSLEPLPSTESVIINPSPNILVTEAIELAGICNSISSQSEIDTANNRINRKLAFYSDAQILDMYSYLLNDPDIKYSMVWSGYPTLYWGYGAWPQHMRDKLLKNLRDLEEGRELELSGPPPLLEVPGSSNYIYISPESAQEIYLAYVAQVLWFERSGEAAWSISEYPLDWLYNLLDSSSYFSTNSSNNLPRYYFANRLVTTTAWNPRIAYNFIKASSMLRASHEETSFSFVDWARAHLRHIQAQEMTPSAKQELFEYQGPIPLEKMLYPLFGVSHISSGCSGTSGILGAMLTTVNIPSLNGITYTSSGFDDQTPSAHSGAILPSLRKAGQSELGLRLHHSDDFYNARYRPWGSKIVPSSQLFYSTSEFEDLVAHPAVIDCIPACNQQGSEQCCNTPWGQASQNNGRYKSLTARQNIPGYYLKQYCQSMEDFIYMLVGPPYALPYLDDEEQQDFIEAANAELLALGSGDLSAGCAKITSMSLKHSKSSQARGPEEGSNLPPTFSWPAPTLEVPKNQTMVYWFPASDSDNQSLSYSVLNPPPGLITFFNYIIWNPQTVGTYYLKLNVTDGAGGTAQQNLVIVVK